MGATPMAVTTTYYWSHGSNSVLNDGFTAGSQSGPAVIGNVAGDRHFAAWSDPGNGDQVEGRIVDASHNPLTGEFTVNNTANAGTTQSDPSVAALTGGNFFVTYTDFAADPDGDIRGRLYSQSGTALGSDFAIDIDNVLNDSDSSVAALSGG